MQRNDRNVIDKIIAVRPYLYAWQDELDEEQERIIGDWDASAVKTAERLIALDNRRIDLCNLKVLYAFIERELGAAFSAFTECMRVGSGGRLYDAAGNAIKRAGYDAERAGKEFGYLFKRLRKSKRDKTATVVSCGADAFTVVSA